MDRVQLYVLSVSEKRMECYSLSGLILFPGGQPSLLGALQLMARMVLPQDSVSYP